MVLYLSWQSWRQETLGPLCPIQETCALPLLHGSGSWPTYLASCYTNSHRLSGFFSRRDYQFLTSHLRQRYARLRAKGWHLQVLGSRVDPSSFGREKHRQTELVVSGYFD
ncbi:hypothetical protein AMTR_s00143p00030290, partial [Amborella trichopoda]